MGSPEHFAPGARLGHLKIERELGEGAFATVWLAVDTLIGRQVALKVMRGPAAIATAEERERILREARLVANLKSPHLVTLYRIHDLTYAGWIVEMEYVDGGSLDDLLRERGRLDAGDVLRIVRGVLLGLQEAHRRKVVHRDVKPGNVLLGKDGSVKLTDFGLGRHLGEASLSASSGSQILGTPLYMAPEVVMGERPTFASDLWSVGVLLYRMVSGRLPFQANNLPNLFVAIQNAEPAPLPADCPRELAQLALRCLSKRAEERPASAAEMLKALDHLIEVSTVASRRGIPTLVPRSRLVGRSGELERLDRALDSVSGGEGTPLLVTGEAGVGKSAFLQEAADRARKRGFRWIEATVTPMGGLLRPLLEGARRALAGESTTGDLTGQINGGRFGSAAPLLRALLTEDSPHDFESRQQTVWAVEQLLTGLAAEGPVGLLIEDTHLCDSEDVGFLKEMIGRLADGRVLLAATYRTFDPRGADDAPGSGSGIHDLASMSGVVHLPLGPLSAEEVYQLLEDQGGGRRIAPQVAEVIVRQSEGIPLYALELFRHLEEAAEIVRTDARIEPGANWRKADLPRRFHDLVARRLEGLPDEERTLLDAAAVDGLEFDGGALAAVLDRPLLSVLRTLQHLYREHALVVPRTNGYRFAHTLFHDVMYQELAPDLRREMHRRLAEHLESRTGDTVDPERLGLHWERAGAADRSPPHLRRAAFAATRRQAYLRALDLARTSGLLGDDLDAPTAAAHAELLFALAGCLSDLGRAEDAEGIVERLLGAAEQLGDERLHLRAAVWREDIRWSAGGAAAVDAGRLQAAVERLPDSPALGRASYLLGAIAKARGDLDGAGHWLQQADRLATTLGAESLQAAARNGLGSLARRRGDLREAEAVYAECARIALARGRRTDAAVSEVNRAIVALERGTLDGLEPALERSIRTLALTGANDRAAHAGVFLAQARYARGDRPGAEQAVQEALGTLERTRYVHALADALLLRSQLQIVAGDLDHARQTVARAREEARRAGRVDAQVKAALVEAYLECIRGRPRRAPAGAARAIELTRRSPEPDNYKPVVLWITQSSVYGLPAGAVESAQEILEARGGRDPFGALGVALLGGARALTRPRGPSEELRRCAAALCDPGVGERHLELRALSGWFAAEAARRDGDDAAADRAVGEALRDAEKLDHVWLQLALLTLRGRIRPDEGGSRRVDALVGRTAAGLAAKEDREQLLRAWHPSGEGD